MEKNVGSTDRMVRIILGVILIVFGILNLQLWYGIAALIIGAVLFVTGLVSRCGLYKVIGMSTCKVD